MSSVEIVVVNYKTYDLLQNFINSYKEFMPKCESHLTIIDVDSEQKFENIKMPVGTDSVRTDWNLGYALSCNYAAFTSESDVIAFFNADTRFIDDNCVDYCVDFLMSNDRVGVVGPLQYDSNGVCTHTGITGTLKNNKDYGWKSSDVNSYRKNYPSITVSGSAYFVKRSVWSEMTNCEIYRSLYPDVIGAFLPTQHYYEETALSYHVQSHGYEVWYLGEAEMIHEWHKSSPVGSEVDMNVENSRNMFIEFCNEHKIEHPYN